MADSKTSTECNKNKQNVWGIRKTNTISHAKVKKDNSDVKDNDNNVNIANIISNIKKNNITNFSTNNKNNVVEDNNCIVDKYVDDYDITKVDIKIKSILEQDQEKLQCEIERLEWIKNNSVLEDDKTKAEELIDKIEREEIDTLNGKELRRYIKVSKPYIGSYKRISGKGNKNNVFGVKKKKLSDDEEKERNKIVSDYLNLARNYITLNLTKVIDKNKSRYCDECENPEELVEESGCLYCEDCGKYFNIYREITKPSIKKDNEEKEQYFKDHMDHYQGKQSTTPNEKVFGVINREMKKYNISKKDVTKDLLREWLKKNKLRDGYKHINYIYHLYTHKDIPNIPDDIEGDILSDVRRFLSIYDDIKGSRKSFLTADFMLKMLLKKNGLEYNDEDFQDIKTENSEKEHTEIWNKGCDILGWEKWKLY